MNTGKGTRLIRLFFSLLSLSIVSVHETSAQEKSSSPPNIIVIYADDLGYGDVGCYGATGVQTPAIDKLAKEGLRFTDAHCTAATCTPSRYSLLTGSYAFRNNAAILPGDAPLIIQPGTTTMAGMLQRAGYETAVIGKWHLGLGDGNINWNKKISPGPNEIGFNYSFLVPATLDRVPCVFVENNYVVNLDQNDPIAVSYGKPVGNEPTGLSDPGMLKMQADTQHSNTIINGISRIGFMTGGHSARWIDEDIPFVLLDKTNRFLADHRDKPFFLYLSYTDIHVPRAPNPRFEHASSMGRRGDAIAQMDWMTGEVMKKLEELHLTDNTLIIFTSDNGPVLDDGYTDFAEEKVGNHKPGGPFRGGKYSAFEAGTRVPTIVYWRGKVKPGVSHALMSQVDLFASIASLAGVRLQSSDAPDSEDLMNAWLSKSGKGKSVMLEESFTMGVREGYLKYIAPINTVQPAWMKNKNIETGFTAVPQLYDLNKDAGEKHNLAESQPGKVLAMQAVLEKIRNKPMRKDYQSPMQKKY